MCEGCNESLKKAQVDNHAARCRSCYAVTCVDCNVTFPDDEYRTHTSCVSEAERYERTIFRGVKKGEEGKGKKMTPQEAWNALILEAGDRKQEADSSIRGYLATLAECSNVPRKQKQFVNFAGNSLKIRNNDALVNKVWAFLEQLRAEKTKEKEDAKAVSDVAKEEQRTVAEEKKSNEKKRKADELVETETEIATTDPVTTAAGTLTPKTVLKFACKVLKKSSATGLNIKALAPAVLALLTKKEEAGDATEEGVKGILKEHLKGSKKIKMEGKMAVLQ